MGPRPELGTLQALGITFPNEILLQVTEVIPQGAGIPAALCPAQGPPGSTVAGHLNERCTVWPSPPIIRYPGDTPDRWRATLGWARLAIGESEALMPARRPLSTRCAR